MRFSHEGAKVEEKVEAISEMPGGATAAAAAAKMTVSRWPISMA